MSSSKPPELHLIELGAPIAEGRTAEIYRYEEGRILKLFRREMPSELRDNEYKINRIVQEANLLVPAVFGIVDVEERHGVVLEKLDGLSQAEMIQRNPARIFAEARALGSLQSAIHNIEHSSLPSQRESLRHRLAKAPGIAQEERAFLLRRLEELPDGKAICHGDLHPGNIILTIHGPVVIDWMTATSGNPLADVARTYLILRLIRPGDANTFVLRTAFVALPWVLATYLRRYFQLRPGGEKEWRRWLPIQAAVRLNEEIASERERLLAIVHHASTW